jgi:hypothetical protein
VLELSLELLLLVPAVVLLKVPQQLMHQQGCSQPWLPPLMMVVLLLVVSALVLLLMSPMGSRSPGAAGHGHPAVQLETGPAVAGC